MTDVRDERNAWISGARAALAHLRTEFRERFQRDLPLEEMLFDRWERAAHLGFGTKTSLHHNSYVYGNVLVGENTWIGPFTILDGSGDLTIGSACSISAGVQIYTHDTVKWALSGGRLAYERSPVVIGDGCYLGPQTVVTRGVTIGSHSVIGASSLVNRDVPPFSVAFGVPCRVRGSVVLGEDGNVELVMHDAHKDAEP